MPRYDLIADVIFHANDDQQAMEIVQGIIATLRSAGHELDPVELQDMDSEGGDSGDARTVWEF